MSPEVDKFMKDFECEEAIFIHLQYMCLPAERAHAVVQARQVCRQIDGTGIIQTKSISAPKYFKNETLIGKEKIGRPARSAGLGTGIREYAKMTIKAFRTVCRT